MKTEASSQSQSRSQGSTVWIVVPLGCFLFLLALIRAAWAPLMDVDSAIVLGMHSVAVNGLVFTNVMIAISASGSALAWQIATVVVTALLLIRRRWVDAVLVVAILSTSSLLNTAAKAAGDRPRPALVDPVAVESGLSFPSGHAQAAIVGYGVLLLIVLPTLSYRWRVAAAVVATTMVVAIGFSRVALGVHYPSDVVGGFALGAGWLTIWVIGRDRWRALTKPLPPTG